MKQRKWIGTSFLTVVLLIAGGMAWAAPHEQQAGVTTAVPQPQVYTPGVGGVGHPECAYCPNPKYSDEALKARFEGMVRLQAVITAQGRATKIIVLKDPSLGLGKEAMDVVKRWKFKPALGPNGNPVDVEAPVWVTFRLPTKKGSKEGSF